MKRIYCLAIAAVVAMAMLVGPRIGAQTKGVITLNTEEFKEKVYDISKEGGKYLGDKPAIVDFYADWCGPCRAISPTLNELAKEFDGKIVIYKVDIDANPELARHFKVRSIPSILYIPLKGEPTMTLGSRDKEKFIKEINSILLGKK